MNFKFWRIITGQNLSFGVTFCIEEVINLLKLNLRSPYFSFIGNLEVHTYFYLYHITLIDQIQIQIFLKYILFAQDYILQMGE